MNNLATILVGALSLVFLGTLHAADTPKPSGNPNIVVILADDKYKHEPETIEKTSYIPRLMPFLSETRI